MLTCVVISGPPSSHPGHQAPNPRRINSDHPVRDANPERGADEVCSESKDLTSRSCQHTDSRVTPLFATLTSSRATITKHAALSLFPATLTRTRPISPLLATLTKNTGVAPISSQNGTRTGLPSLTASCAAPSNPDIQTFPRSDAFRVSSFEFRVSINFQLSTIDCRLWTPMPALAVNYQLSTIDLPQRYNSPFAPASKDIFGFSRYSLSLTPCTVHRHPSSYTPGRPGVRMRTLLSDGLR